MRAANLMQVLPKLVQRRRPAMLWGSPGAGKTDVINAVANSMNRRVVDFRLAMRDPTALMGFPMPDVKAKSMKFFRDAELPTEGEGILFLDEINSASQATQAAAMQLTLTGKIGDYDLPPGWSILAAGNRESDRSVVHRMPAALSLRLRHIDFEVNNDDWVEWALGRLHTDVISFIRFRPGLLDKFDPQARCSPTPRGWEFVNEEYVDNHDPADLFEVTSGIIGEGPAGEFKGFIDQIKHLPKPEQIMLAPDKTEVPDSPATQFALATALGEYSTPNNMDTLMQYVQRMPVEYQVLYVRDAVRKDQSVCNTPSFVQWSLKNSKVMS